VPPGPSAPRTSLTHCPSLPPAFLPGRLQEAVKLLDAVLAAEPAQAGALVGRGSARAMLGDLPGAIADLSAAIKVEPRCVARRRAAPAALPRRHCTALHCAALRCTAAPALN
jgi:hypothetical protein